MEKPNNIKVLRVEDEFGTVKGIAAFPVEMLDGSDIIRNKMMGIVKEAVEFDNERDYELLDEIIDASKALSHGSPHEFNGEYTFTFDEVPYIENIS